MEDKLLIQHASSAPVAITRPDHRHAKNSSPGYLRLLAEFLMVRQSAQRPALSRRLGLPRQLISDLLADLEFRGLVHVAGAFDGLPGRSQQSYTLRTTAALALGCDVGEKVTGVLCDMRGTIVAEYSELTRPGGAEALVVQIAGMADALCNDACLPRLHIRHTVVGPTASIDLQGPLSHLFRMGDASLTQSLTIALGGAVFLDKAGVLETAEFARQRMLEDLFGAIPAD